MRMFFMLAMATIAHGQVVDIINMTHPASNEFQIGDRFEIRIRGMADQPISVRTIRNGRIDWGPIINRTDASGLWAMNGRFERQDFGEWNEAWTVGGKLAKPVIHFSVGAPCLQGRQGLIMMSQAMAVTCETVEGSQTFVTPSDAEPFRTPDARLVTGQGSNLTVDEYQAKIMQYLITDHTNNAKSRALGGEAEALIANIIGPNALSEAETRNVLSIIHAAFEKPDRIPQVGKETTRTLLFLQNLTNSTDQESLKQEIAGTIAFVQAQ